MKNEESLDYCAKLETYAEENNLFFEKNDIENTIYI